MLENVSLIFVYGAMLGYTIAMIAFAIDFSGLKTRRNDAPRKAASIGMAVITLAFALHLVGTVLRGVAAERVPWANMYEFTLTYTLVAVGTFLVIQKWRDLRALGVFVALATLVTLGLGVSVLYVKVQGTPPILDSYWLIIHVSTATIAMGIFAVAAILSALQLYQHSKEDEVATIKATVEETTGAEMGGSSVATATKVRRGVTKDNLPSAAELESYAFRLTVVGFLLWTFTLIAGAIWAEHSWGRPWNWDPKETVSLIVWFVYAAYLHARSTRGWEGRRAAWLCLAGFAALLFNYFGVTLFADSRHAYSGVN